jgi:glycosyltransferase involved in cell wall biosynthesis
VKIAFLAGNPFAVGGMERVLSVLGLALAGRHDVTIVYETGMEAEGKAYFYPDKIDYRSGEAFFDVKGTYLCRKVLRRINERVIPIKSTKLLAFIYYPKKMRDGLAELIDRGGFDAVIGTGGKYGILLGLIAGRCTSRLIGWEHNTYDAYFRMRKRYFWRQEALLKKTAAGLDELVVLTRRDACEYGKNLGRPVRCIYNPLTVAPDAVSDCTRKRLLFVGRLICEQKGLRLLAEVLKIVFSKHGDWVLDVVGYGEDEARFKRLIKESGLDDHVIFHGRQTDVSGFYRRSSILLLTSKWEGFGLVATEAMAYGLPVVSFKTNGPMEIIDDGVNGFLADNYDVGAFARDVMKLIDDPQLRVEMGKNARERAAFFRIDRILEAWEGLLSGQQPSDVSG